MQSSLRRALGDSRAGVVAIIMLLVWAAGGVCFAASQTAHQLAPFVMTGIAIRGLPTLSPGDVVQIARAITDSCGLLLIGAMDVMLAIVLSQWLYGTNPLPALRTYVGQITRRSHA